MNEIKTAIEAIAVALNTVKANHEHHETYDEYGGYPESELCEQNMAAIAMLSALTASADSAQEVSVDTADAKASEREAFDKWAESRGVWPRLTHEEIFFAGYRAAECSNLRLSNLQAGEPVGEVKDKPENESGSLTWPRVVWKDGLFAIPPVGTKLYTVPPSQQAGKDAINFDVIRRSYGFTIDDDGRVHGLTAGDMGYEDTGIQLCEATMNIINMQASPAQAEAQQSKPEWRRITQPGQVKAGDRLRFTIGDDKYSETAKEILHPGTEREEIIYNKRRNYYLITSMAIGNKGSQKNVEFLARQGGGEDA